LQASRSPCGDWAGDEVNADAGLEQPAGRYDPTRWRGFAEATPSAEMGLLNSKIGNGGAKTDRPSTATQSAIKSAMTRRTFVTNALVVLLSFSVASPRPFLQR
jgi:hypothetical protein